MYKVFWLNRFCFKFSIKYWGWNAPVKVIWYQNVIFVSSNRPKNQQNFVSIARLNKKTFKTLIFFQLFRNYLIRDFFWFNLLQNFRWYFWSIWGHPKGHFEINWSLPNPLGFIKSCELMFLFWLVSRIWYQNCSFLTSFYFIP